MALKFTVLPSDRTGCGYYRLIWPAEAIRAMGHQVAVVDHLEAVWQDVLGVPQFVRAVPTDADVVIAQRVFRPNTLALLRSLKDQGTAIVVDLDDDLGALAPDHPAWRQLHGGGVECMKEACRLADVLTVSTPALAAKYGSNARVVPNGIPQAYLGIGGKRALWSGLPVIGWTGTPLTHLGDLEEVGSAVAGICAEGVARFRAIGSRSTLDVLGVPGQEHQPGVQLATFDYARAVHRLDVGIVPVRDSAFNASKSWLKGLEYASLGVPFVASPRAEYVSLHGLGAGVLARRERDWRRQLAALVQSSDLRLTMAAQGRLVASRLTVEQYTAPQALEAWTAAAERNASPRHASAVG